MPVSFGLRPRVAASLVAAGLIVWADPLLLSPVHTALTALTGGSLLLLSRLAGGRLPTRPGRWSLVLMAILLTSAAGSGYAWNGLQYGVAMGGIAAFGLLWVDARPRSLSRGLVWWYGLIALVLLVPILWRYGRQIQLLGGYGWLHFPNGPLRNPNVLARYLGLSGLVLVGLRSRHSAAGPLGWVLLGGCVWTGSRGAMLGLTAALGTALGRRFFSPRALGRAFLAAVILFLGVAVLVGSPGAATNLQRLQLIPESLAMWSRHPWTGVGGWNFGLVYPEVSADGRWQRHPHSLPLLLLSEFGLAGVLTAILAGAVLWRRGWPARGRPLVAFLLVHELVDTMVWIPGAVLFAAPALAWSGAAPSDSDPRRGPSGTVFALILVVLSLGVGGVDVLVERGIRATGRGAWGSARRLLVEKVTGVGSAHRALAEERGGRPDRARFHLRRALVLNRYDPYYPFLLSRLLDERGQTTRARWVRREAWSRDPHDMMRMRNDVNDTSPSTGHGGDDTSPLRPERLYAQPHRARWYLPLVDRSLRRGRIPRALRQIDLLSGFDKVSWSTRAGLVARRARCYRIRGDTDVARRWDRILERMRRVRDRVRPQFHRFFYRRPGYDHALLP